jgi:hypothetical protein
MALLPEDNDVGFEVRGSGLRKNSKLETRNSKLEKTIPR